MKKFLLAMLLASALALSVKSQTKGTNAVGLGFGSNSNEYQYNLYPENSSKQKNNFYSLSFGHFINDNSKISIIGTSSNQNVKGGANVFNRDYSYYAGDVEYQRYYPLFKKIYAFAAGGLGYSRENTSENNSGNSGSSFRSNIYRFQANGGLAFFVSKHLALETKILSAGTSYYDSKASDNNETRKANSFSFSSSGSITDLNFNIYFLF